VESHLGDRRSGAGRVMGPAACSSRRPTLRPPTPGIRSTSDPIRAITRAPPPCRRHAGTCGRECEPRLRENAEQQQRLVVLLHAVPFDFTHD